MPDRTPSIEPVVVHLHKRMSTAEYEVERERLRALYGDTWVETHAKFDQAFALLFYRSGWTQEELAKKEEKSQKWVDFRLRFGRFLHFSTTVLKAETLPKNLTERRFRSFWEQTDKTESNERVRFGAVHRAMQDCLQLTANKRRKIGRELVEQFGDGQWHQIEVIARQLKTDMDHVEETLRGMRAPQPYGATNERKKVGTHFEVRIFKMDKMVGLHELANKLAPIIKDLKEQGKQSKAAMSPPTVLYLAGRIQKLLDEWAE